MKSLIIGGAGFVGGYLIETLLSRGDEVFVTKLPQEKIENLGVRVLDINIVEKDSLRVIFEDVKPDVIFHLAAQSSVKYSWINPQLTVDVNVKGAINLFETAKDYAYKGKILVIGSSEEYGKIDYNLPVKEETTPVPQNVYALTKVAQENAALIYSNAFDLDIVMTRSFNHFGPRQGVQFVVADFCSQVAKIERGEQEPIIRVGNLSSRRDFTDVRDVVSAYLILSEKGKKGEIYNVGSGKTREISEILKFILSLAKTKITIEIDRLKYRPIDVLEIKANTKKINELGWAPKIPIEETLADTLKYFREINL